MKYLVKCVALCGLLASSNIGYAQEMAEPGNQLRMDFSFNNYSTVLDNGNDRLSMGESSLEGVFTLQSSQGIYGQFGFGSFDMYEMDYNGQIVDPQIEYTSRMFGLGYRMARRGTQSRFWGFGLQNTRDNEDGAEALNIIRTFWEKDNLRRYGVIELAYSSSTDFGLLSVSGRHVWFANSGFGFGLTWGVGSGFIEAEPGYTDIGVGAANLGAVLMFRPKF